KAVRPGGWVFVGDVRSLPLLSWLYRGIELARSADEVRDSDLRASAARRVREEPELVLDHEFFPAWAAVQPTPGSAVVEVKRGRHCNELTKFRYDAVLHVGVPASGGPREWAEVAWGELGSLAALDSFLREKQPGGVVIRDVPAARLAGDRRLVE